MHFIFIFLFGCGDETSEVTTHEHRSTEQGKNKKAKEIKKEDPTKPEHKGHQHTSTANTIDPGKILEGSKVFFVSPKDGEEVSSPLKIQMGVEGMKVQPAGAIVEGTGHHHIIVDADPVKKGSVVIGDAQHIHFGKGQTETELQLQPGKHTLQLQFANGAHISYGEQLRSQITVTVK